MQTEKIYQKDNNIFQSEVWVEFQKAIGRKAIEIDGNYFYKEHLIRDKYFLYNPRAEITNSKIQISNKLQSLKDQSIVFVRTEPNETTTNTKKGLDSRCSALSSRSKSCGENDNLRPVTKNSILSQQYSPKQTLVLDLTKSEEELLAGMKSKHRYNIHLAEKKGVEIKSGYSDEDIDNFYALSLEVSKRDNTFSPHQKSYYDKMVKTLGPKGNLKIFTAFFDEEPISSIIVLFQNETAVYLHGASSGKYREFMPNHLVQWTAIRKAKERGCKFYDFWGAALKAVKSSTGSHPSAAGKGPIEDFVVAENHSWAGITKFKLGFVKIGETGEVLDFPGAYDLPLNKFWYNGLSILNRLRKLIKR